MGEAMERGSDGMRDGRERKGVKEVLFFILI